MFLIKCLPAWLSWLKHAPPPDLAWQSCRPTHELMDVEGWEEVGLFRRHDMAGTPERCVHEFLGLFRDQVQVRCG